MILNYYMEEELSIEQGMQFRITDLVEKYDFEIC